MFFSPSITKFMFKRLLTSSDHSHQGAVAALHMVHCFHLAGFPKGLISCVTGKGSEIGDFLTMHPGVNCIRYSLFFNLFV